ncbi:hypothetical protein CANARDRAFT_27428 [[Candida] arabinofermentans NRRL YB-2248]|uniref:Histidine biosynthesis trifunctional protein n=1 Tax=[Candida] arabinofermentans NRRL YB-2248 TaxID=983967 RepID=A0A1E4T340_9ASCO|nr:hypothetical protein CANARDRAFT_27428 [[Candida] arabinofermentans NRRL YB-2248]
MVFPLLPYFSSPSALSSLAVVGQALLQLTSSNVGSLIDVSKDSSITTFVDIPSDLEIDDSLVDSILSLLNNGVEGIFVSPEAATAILSSIPNARLVYKLSSTDQVEQLGLSQTTSISLPSSQPLGSLKSLTNGGKRQVYSTYEQASKVDVSSNVSAGITPIISADQLTVDYTEDESAQIDGKLSIVDALLPALITDRNDGLYTTLVTDSANTALGLVYSSKKSISEAIKTGTGVYQSRRHGLWYKGKTSGATQKLLKIELDCDGDCLKFIVEQSGAGFCHLDRASCFGKASGLSALEQVLVDRKTNAPEGSYTKRLFDDEKLLSAKIKEEAEELTDATTKEEISWEMADLLYFALARCVKYGVSLADIEKNLDTKALKVTRRKGDAKPKFIQQEEEKAAKKSEKETSQKSTERVIGPDDKIVMSRVDATTASKAEVDACLERPIQKSADIMNLVTPIVNKVKNEGDKALLELTAKFDRVELTSPILAAPFPPELMQISDDIKKAIDISFENIRVFHEAQNQTETLTVETCPGVTCSRFARPIERVGCYIPGGTAVLPSTSLMLSVPALVAGCKDIIFASPPGKDGKLTAEVVYVAHKVGAKCIVLAGGAQAVAAMAYGTESVPKCDKIMGPGNQFVTAAKMLVSNDSNAMCAIDMPAGPSEVLVIADKYADPDFVASDLLSQAEHGVDSQVILITVDMTSEEVDKIDEAVHRQALVLPRVDIVRKCIAHSTTIQVANFDEAFDMSNRYAPEHLILQIEDAGSYIDKVFNAGSVFVGAYSPESCGDYSSGTNHTLPTYGYARMYSGVNTTTFQKFITSQVVTPLGLQSIGKAVMDLAAVEGLDAHRNAVKVRMEKLGYI